jgi:riboflavin kinase/FMN adenylyltransferase
LKQRLPHLAAIHVGENFRFGRGRTGDVAVLVAAGVRHGVRVFSVPRVTRDGGAISSTRIRALLEAGDIAAANALLGYAYFAHGFVTPGKRLGRTIGFPTLNVAWVPQLRPRFGVYAVHVFSPDTGNAKPLPAVANYGVRPTVELATEPCLEIHVLGACPFAEGDHVKAEWLEFLRPESKFANLDELRAQIARDRVQAEAFFSH